MEKVQGLKTLGDYRRAARDSLYSIYLPPDSNTTSDYDAIKTALENTRNIISSTRSNFSDRDWWAGRSYPGTQYEMINPTLFECIKLMEFAIMYHDKSIDILYPYWPKSSGARMVFTCPGLSYLEAGFDFVCKQGSDVIGILQNTYLHYKKEGKRPYVRYCDPLIFLNKNPKVDDLEINPEPNKIIKTWFDNMLRGTKSEFPESEYSRHRVETEFNSIEKNLEYEWKANSAAKKRKPVKKALEKVLDEYPDLKGQPDKLTIEVNKKLVDWGYAPAKKGIVKNAQTNIRKKRQKQKSEKN